MDEQQRANLTNLPNQPNSQDDHKKEAEEQMRRDLLATVLDAAARERLSRIALVSSARSRQIEEILMRMAQTGQLRGRVSETQLIELLEQVEGTQASSGTKKPTIIFQRRNAEVDDDDWNFGL